LSDVLIIYSTEPMPDDDLSELLDIPSKDLNRLKRELYEELPALAAAALKVSKSMTPGPEGEGESPDSFRWAGSALGSPELGI
jgi:hypothetical protein